MAKLYAPTTDKVSQKEKDHAGRIRDIAAQCMVLLENDGSLPFTETKGKLALFGNGARQTVKGGTGSGGVNSRYTVNIEQGLEAAGFRITTKSWLDGYDKIVEDSKAAFKNALEAEAKEKNVPPFLLLFEHPYKEPQIQPVTKEDVEQSDTDTAIYVLARNSGEGADRNCEEGDYLLSREEIEALQYLGRSYHKLILLLNVGGVIDTKAIKNISGINAVLLISQAGSITGHAVADALCARTVPSGKLVDTWAMDYSDYPSSDNFGHNDGDVDDEYYTEGIYVGYRYFDRFNVTPSYCFGYGLSYTDFRIETKSVQADEEKVTVTVEVTNTGKIYSGKEVVQVYYSAPAGKLEKPYQELAAFGKTGLLKPGEQQTLKLSFHTNAMASYSEAAASYVMEQGEYLIRVGSSSRSTRIEAVILLNEEAVISVHKNLFKDEKPLDEITARGIAAYTYEAEAAEKLTAVVLPIDAKKIPFEKIEYQSTNKCYPSAIRERITMKDVMDEKYSVEELAAQLTVEEMAQLCVGTTRGGLGARSIIGAASAAVPGAAGDTTSLLLEDRDVRNLILADGPAGLRLQPHFKATKDGKLIPGGYSFGDTVSEFELDGINPEDVVDHYQYASAIPIATLLASSWDMELLEEAGYIVGEEMLLFGVNLWLAPGMNIHRNPLCGRNFEYYSEDPLLAGMCAAADTKGVQSHPGIGTTIKHFAANNQEDNRMFTNSHISERALREIYLKGFEIAVRTAQPMSLMTSYNLINGIHSANNYDLLTAVLRNEWGFAGFVMTDWCTSMEPMFEKDKHRKYPISSSVLCIKSGNDLQMPGCEENIDDILTALKPKKDTASGVISKADLQACAINILRVIRYSSCYESAKPYTQHFLSLPWAVKAE